MGAKLAISNGWRLVRVRACLGNSDPFTPKGSKVPIIVEGRDFAIRNIYHDLGKYAPHNST